MYRRGTWTFAVLVVVLGTSSAVTGASVWDSSDESESIEAIPTLVSSEEITAVQWPPLSIGSKVVRGPDWEWGTQGSGTVGTVERIAPSGWYTVRWGDGHVNGYRYSEGKHDIKLAPAGATSAPDVAETSTSTTHATTSPRSYVLPKGTLVKRGKDWRWDDQDLGGIGVVQGPSIVKGWFYVKWAHGETFSYRYGVDGKFDLKIVTGEDTDSDSEEVTASTKSSMPDLKVGDQVVRYKDWSWGSQDVGGIGTVTMVMELRGIVHVQWKDGSENNYNYGRNGLYDVRRATAEDLVKLVISGRSTATPYAAEESSSSGETVTEMPELKIGDKVIRGKDWKWGDQGNNTVGTVVGDLTSQKWIGVLWADDHRNNYRYGHEGKFDIQLASTASRAGLESSSGPTAPAPPVLPGCPLKTGDKVVRGPNWMWSSQDIGIGVVLRKGTSTGWLRVRWSDGSENTYRCGSNGSGNQFFDVKLASEEDIAAAPVSTSTTIRSVGGTSKPVLKIGDKVVRGADWKWGSQGGGTVGVIVEELDSDLWIKVKWGDGTTNTYRYGYQSQYDLQLASEAPSTPSSYIDTSNSTEVSSTSSEASDGMPILKTGDKVVRGADWEWGEQGKGTLGTVRPVGGLLSIFKWVSIQWADGETNTYRYGDDGKYDVRLATEEEIARLTTMEIPTSTKASVVGLERRLPASLKIGDSVVRGPTWKWGSQDVGTGTVIPSDLSIPGWVRVRWANSAVHRYRYDPEEELYDIQLASEDSDEEDTATPEDSETSTTSDSSLTYPALKKGDRVVRGPAWRWGNQGAGTTGTVEGPSHSGWLSVRWDNGDEYNYRYGDDGAYDIKLATSEEATTTVDTSLATSEKATTGVVEPEPTSEDQGLFRSSTTTNIPITTQESESETTTEDANIHEVLNVAPSFDNEIEE